MKKRLPEKKPEDLVAVLLDPLTKPFAKLWLGDAGYAKAKRHLKKQHRDLYVKIHSDPTCSETEEQLEEEPHQPDTQETTASSNDIDDDAVDLTTADGEEEESVDYEAEADSIFKKWIKFKPKYNDFLYEDVEKINNMNQCTITELVDKFDSAKYFKVRRSWIFLLLSIHSINLPLSYRIMAHRPT